MIAIRNTNHTLVDGQYIITFENVNERLTVICNDAQATLKKYRASGHSVFSASQYHDGAFYKLTKRLTAATLRGRQIVILNELWHILTAQGRNQLIIEQ